MDVSDRRIVHQEAETCLKVTCDHYDMKNTGTIQLMDFQIKTSSDKDLLELFVKIHVQCQQA